MSRLRAMFLIVGTVITGGVTYSLAVLLPGNTQADAVDAGLLTISTPARLRCALQVHPDCQLLPDGGQLPRYVRAQIRARRIPLDPGGGADNIIVFDVPDRADGGFCVRPIGTVDEACEVLEATTCTPNVVCGQQWPVIEPQQCACRNPAAGNCFTSNQADGGNPFQAPLGATIAPGRWQGVGCVRKFCGPVVFGDTDDGWPEECPQ